MVRWRVGSPPFSRCRQPAPAREEAQGSFAAPVLLEPRLQALGSMHSKWGRAFFLGPHRLFVSKTDDVLMVTTATYRVRFDERVFERPRLLFHWVGRMAFYPNDAFAVVRTASVDAVPQPSGPSWPSLVFPLASDTAIAGVAAIRRVPGTPAFLSRERAMVVP